MNNPLMFTDPNGYWFGWDDLVAATVGFITGYVSYGITTGNWWSWKAVAAGGIGAAVAWVGWNTGGSGKAVLDISVGHAPTFSAGLSAVFSSSGGWYGAQYGVLTFMNSWAHKSQLNEADEKGWGGVFAFAGYATSAVLSLSLKPFTIGAKQKHLGLKQLIGVILTNNISDNMKDGIFDFHSFHVGVLGYDWKYRKDETWGGIYTVFSKGMRSDQQFDMAFEMILGLCLINTDIKLPRYRDYAGGCGGQWLPTANQFNSHVIALSKLGYYAKRTLDLSDSFFQIWKNKTTFQYWYSTHYNNNGTIND